MTCISQARFQHDTIYRGRVDLFINIWYKPTSCKYMSKHIKFKDPSPRVIYLAARPFVNKALYRKSLWDVHSHPHSLQDEPCATLIVLRNHVWYSTPKQFWTLAMFPEMILGLMRVNERYFKPLRGKMFQRHPRESKVWLHLRPLVIGRSAHSPRGNWLNDA